MPFFNCNAWIFDEGPPMRMEAIILDKKLFAATRPIAIQQFVDEEVIPANDDSINGPALLDDISIAVETLPEVPNWQP